MKFIAKFHPQKRLNALTLLPASPLGEVSFDVTREIVATGGYLPDRDTEASDELRHAASAPKWVQLWTGPYFITVEQID